MQTCLSFVSFPCFGGVAVILFWLANIRPPKLRGNEALLALSVFDGDESFEFEFEFEREDDEMRSVFLTH